jgi:hypothetical protein
MRLKLLTAVAGAMMLGAASAAGAQTYPALSGQPDVLILVYQQPGRGDQVDITYAHTVPHAQAQKDLAALAATTGWPIGVGKVTDAAPPVQGKIGPMTSVTFAVPNVVQNETHTLPVEPFITAFRHYKRLNLIFSVGAGFQFQGQGSYADNNVRIILDQHGPAYIYQVQILNPNFEHLGLPTTGSVPQVAPPSGSRLKPLLALAAAAVGLGLLVYLLLARGARTAPKDKPAL